MAWACSIAEALDIPQVALQHLTVGDRKALMAKPTIIRQNKCGKIKEVIKQIALSIEAKIVYPSYTSECFTCPFSQGCRF
jgi:hypothetical protein